MNRAEKRREIREGFKKKLYEVFKCTWRTFRRHHKIKGKLKFGKRIQIVNFFLRELENK